jgi:hypothetical protein
VQPGLTASSCSTCTASASALHRVRCMWKSRGGQWLAVPAAVFGQVTVQLSNLRMDTAGNELRCCCHQAYRLGGFL